ncbi:hypothetical protein XELAEV_18041813mg [Xenopus laevis]|uniref:Uncharacterized protein n=1 Tax=Xenopus laevis TaxID=8355 RepID=A0A974C2Y2_XENLA|nr:hypothetical protein XELAEV_18041813mg [Xenopus laevis]
MWIIKLVRALMKACFRFYWPQSLITRVIVGKVDNLTALDSCFSPIFYTLVLLVMQPFLVFPGALPFPTKQRIPCSLYISHCLVYHFAFWSLKDRSGILQSTLKYSYFTVDHFLSLPGKLLLTNNKYTQRA